MTHPLLRGKPELSAKIATEEFKRFVELYPESTLKVIFVIFNNPEYEELYKIAAYLLTTD